MSPVWINRRMIVTPDDLSEKSYEGTVVAAEGRAVALRLSVPVRLSSGKECHHLVASIRHASRTIEDVMAGSGVLCALTLVPFDKFDPAQPCNVSWWRGDGVAIGDICVVTTSSV